MGALALLVIASQKYFLGMAILFSFYQVVCSNLQTELLPSGVEQGWTALKGGQRPTLCSLKYQLLSWNWFCLSEQRQIRIFNI